MENGEDVKRNATAVGGVRVEGVGLAGGYERDRNRWRTSDVPHL